MICREFEAEGTMDVNVTRCEMEVVSHGVSSKLKARWS